MRVEDFARSLLLGDSVAPIDNPGGVLIELDAPVPGRPDRGFEIGVTPAQAVQVRRAMQAWERVYRQYHPEAYRAILEADPE